MAPWPSYHFLDLDEAQKHARRESLDHYAAIAHASTLLPVLVAALYRLLSSRWNGSKSGGGGGGGYTVVPGSPALKHQRSRGGSSSGSLGATAFRASVWLRKASWWLGDDVVFLGKSWGQIDQLVFGLGWTAWLVVLCFVGTGDDYLHLTKRLGIIAVTQFPLQYALSLKQLNPVAWAFGSSHERVNRIHRPLGSITYGLLVVHAALYLNFFYQTGVLGLEKLTRPVPALGLGALGAMTLLMSTSMGLVRRWSYRLFFVAHLFVAMALPVAVFFHAHSARILVAESLALLLADIGIRRLGTVDVDTKVTRVGGAVGENSRLIKMDMDLPSDALYERFAGRRDTVSAHVYLNVPQAARPRPETLLSPANLPFELMFNPFTIAAADAGARKITLVAKRNAGPMTANLYRLAGGGGGGGGGGNGRARRAAAEVMVPLGIQGPFGCSRKFPDLNGPEFGRVLLVAGGVGATFILPIFRALVSETRKNKARRTAGETGVPDLDQDHDTSVSSTTSGRATTAAAAGRGTAATGQRQHPRVKMIWAVRSSAEAAWATEMYDDLIGDDDFELFITGDIDSRDHSDRADADPSRHRNGSSSSSDDDDDDDDDQDDVDEAVPLTSLPPSGTRRNAADIATDTGSSLLSSSVRTGRPDLAVIVSDVFKQQQDDGKKVAVLVCGPAGMARELRRHVGAWVTHKGRDVWWHDEGFSW
ncbi:ferric-chelate reductase [Microdochium nivale]|nr:ferric-chelate reductase [Microdochium nivale]